MLMLFVEPKPCGTVRIAADRKGAVADCQPNRAKFEPAIADCGLGNCQVLCIFIMYMWIAASAHACRGGGHTESCCDKAQHHSRKIYHPTPLSKIVTLGALGSNYKRLLILRIRILIISERPINPNLGGMCARGHWARVWTETGSSTGQTLRIYSGSCACYAHVLCVPIVISPLGLPLR